MVIKCRTPAPPLVNAMLPAFKLPAPTESVLIKPLFALGIVIPPDTESVIPELIDKVMLLPA